MAEPGEITSLLWKAALLARESVVFPRLVETAALHIGKRYDDRMLRTVAADTAILAALHVPVGEGVDAVLTTIVATDTDVDLDGLITAAVTAYQEPTT